MSYDGAGNVTNDGYNSYVYDAEGRICAVKGPQGMIGYQYDAAGNRIGKGTIASMSCDLTANGYVPTTDYVLDQAGGQMTEVAVGGGTQTWVHTNVTADGMLIATYDTTGSGLHFHLSDALGSRRVQTDAAGFPEQICQSLPFGNQLYCTGSLDNPTEHHFTGKERDIESGLDYFGARYYASNMGRWMSPDWADKPEAVPYSSLDNPQSLNLYGYVGNNPLSRADADGHCCTWDEVKDFSIGTLKGTVASLTGGALGSAPSSSDSAASLQGQLFGSAGVTAAGIVTDLNAAGAVGGGLILAPETGGLSLTVSAAGVAEGVVGTALIAGGSNNAAAVGNAMQRRAGDFSNSTREGAIKDNAAKNGGTNKCEKCGGDVQRVGNQKGQSPPGDQLQVHHDPAIKDGGGKDSKPVVVCRDCHVDIHKQ